MRFKAVQIILIELLIKFCVKNQGANWLHCEIINRIGADDKLLFVCCCISVDKFLQGQISFPQDCIAFIFQDLGSYTLEEG